MELFGTILMGIPLLFIGFIILWGIEIIIVKLIRKLTGKEPKAPVKPAAPAKSTSAAPVNVQIEDLGASGIGGGAVKLYNVDEITAAMIMAIVSDNTGIPLNQLVFKSIRAIKEF